MIYLLIAIYVVVCLLILYKTITQFDWFSAILYTLIFIVSCGILYLLLFTPYYLLN